MLQYVFLSAAVCRDARAKLFQYNKMELVLVNNRTGCDINELCVPCNSKLI